MNMISTGAFLPEMDASNQQETMAEKFARVWEKKNSKVARAGGVSLMALSLAACGSSSDDTATTTPTTPTTPAEPTTPVVTPAALTLTDGNDIFDADDFTTAADTITAAQANYGSADVIAEPNAGDGDTLTITATNDVTTTPTVVGVENIVFNAEAFSTAAGTGTVFDVDAARIADGSVTLNVTQIGSTIVAGAVTNAGGITVVAGTDIATLTVTEAEATSATVIDAGDATRVNANGSAATSDVDIIVNGDVTLDIGTADGTTITATAASEITLQDAASATDTMTTTSADVNLIAGSDLSDFDGDTVTGFVSVEGTIGAGDFTGVDALMIITDDSGADANAIMEIADGARISTLDANEVIQITANDDQDADVNGLIGATVSLDIANAAGVTISDGAADASEDTISTLNVIANEDTSSFAVTTVATVDTTLNLSGAGDVTLTHTAGGTEALTVSGGSMTGVLTVAATGTTLDTITSGAGDDNITVDGGDADGASVNTGAGDDRVKVDAGEVATVDGGAGIDTIAMDGDVDEVTFSGFEILETEGAAITNIDASALSGLSIVVDSTDGGITIDNTDVAVVNLSGLNVNTAANGVTINTDTGRDTAQFTTAQTFTVTGTNANDTITGYDNADTINGGLGEDAITGGAGADTLTGGGGYDDFIIASGDSGEATMDIITDYVVYDTTDADSDTITLDSSADVNAGAGGTTDATVTLTLHADVAALAGTHDVSGADADAAATDIDAVITDGIMTLEGDDAAVIDTLAEWVDAALASLEVEEGGGNLGTDAADVVEYAVAFEFGGNTYIVTALDSDASADSTLAINDVVQLTGITGSTLDLGAGAVADSIIIA